MLSTLHISIHLSTYNNTRKTVLLSIVFKRGNGGTEKLCNLTKVTELTRPNKAIWLQSQQAHSPGHAASQTLTPGLSSPPPAPPPSHQMSHRRLSRQRTLLKMFSSILPTLSCFIGSDETFVTTTAIAMIISTLKTFAYKAGTFLFKVNIGAAEKLPPIPIHTASFPLRMPPNNPHPPKH